jgi:sugar phosphate isomerase/epimerase
VPGAPHNPVDRLAVCSWSLRPRGPEELAEALHAADVRRVQLALDPLREGLWSVGRTRAVLRDAGVALVSGMMTTKGEDYTTLESIRVTGGVRPDEHWPANAAAAADNARIARELGLALVTFHAGFLPHGSSGVEQRLRATMLDRLRTIARAFAERGVGVGMETGQESAATLLGVLGELPGVGVNFDPANMLLYGMGEPVEALRLLLPRVVQAHIKDAIPNLTPGRWGEEVPVGEGRVDWPGFFGVLRSAPRVLDLVIEREAGENRLADIRTAARFIREYSA